MKLNPSIEYGILLCEAVNKEYTMFMDYHSKKAKVFVLNDLVYGINNNVYKRNLGKSKKPHHEGFTQDIKKEPASGDMLALLVEVHKKFIIPRHILVSPEIYRKVKTVYNLNHEYYVSSVCFVELGIKIKNTLQAVPAE